MMGTGECGRARGSKSGPYVQAAALHLQEGNRRKTGEVSMDGARIRGWAGRRGGRATAGRETRRVQQRHQSFAHGSLYSGQAQSTVNSTILSVSSPCTSGKGTIMYGCTKQPPANWTHAPCVASAVPVHSPNLHRPRT
jgi:hypothetical protein